YALGGTRALSRPFLQRRGWRGGAARGGRVTRVIVAGATGRTGAPVTAGIVPAKNVGLAARVAPSLAGAGPGRYGSVAEALADVPADVFVDFTRPELGE